MFASLLPVDGTLGTHTRENMTAKAMAFDDNGKHFASLQCHVTLAKTA